MDNNVKLAKDIAKLLKEKHSPYHINNREELGHWEIDSVIGLRIVCLLSSKTNDNVVKEVKKIIKSKKYIIKSITSDNGSEFANIKEITDSGIDWYFAHSYCSNERGCNENNNKMVRRFIPKGVSMNYLRKKDVKHIETFMNNYPRKIFNALTSNQVYECLLNLA
nr:IS30 family transposase [Streptobacillus canis]